MHRATKFNTNIDNNNLLSTTRYNPVIMDECTSNLAQKSELKRSIVFKKPKGGMSSRNCLSTNGNPLFGKTGANQDSAVKN